MYKIISKLLETRLAKVIDKLISKSQTAFIHGRQVLYEILVMNEVIDFTRRKKKECLLFNVDFSEAYECVDWVFFRGMLINIGFGETCLRWMDTGVFNSNMSILINGSPTSEFQATRGLRQGDTGPLIYL